MTSTTGSSTAPAPLRWELVPDREPVSSPHLDAQRRQAEAALAAERSKLPLWERMLPPYAQLLADREAAVDPAQARFDQATDAFIRRYHARTGGQVGGQGGRPVVWFDDERVEPERTRRQLAATELALAKAQASEAREWLAQLHRQIAWARG